MRFKYIASQLDGKLVEGEMEAQSTAEILVFLGRKGLVKTENHFLYKFRTMIDGAINKGLGNTVSENDDRITKTGKFLRKWKEFSDGTTPKFCLSPR